MTDPRPLMPRDVLTASDVRRLAGGIARHTLLAWRRDRGFPEPWKTAKQGRGVKAQRLELWDRAEVRRWLKDHPPTV